MFSMYYVSTDCKSALSGIFHKALSDKTYECSLSSETKMPMMYMDDAIAATIQIMQAPVEEIKIRSSYNLAAMSFTPTARICNPYPMQLSVPIYFLILFFSCFLCTMWARIANPRYLTIRHIRAIELCGGYFSQSTFG
jgi:hypothetical protein